MLDGKVPPGPIEQKWDQCRFDMKLVSPANRRKHTILVVGSGLAGAAAAATLGEQGYQVQCFSFHDSPRRAHSIAAQGGINAAKNYRNDGDSVYRLFYDTIKGGDFRAREGNAYRLAQVSVDIIDQCVAQGVPFAREYGGLLATRSFGGVQVERTFYARGQTGQQLLLGAYQALERQIAAGTVTMHPHSEMLDLVVVDGKARGIVTRNLRTGAIRSYSGDAVVLATGGYGNVFYLSTNAKACKLTAIWRAYRRGAYFANPCFTQIHPTCIPVTGDHQSKLTLMSESLRNDGRVWVPKKKGDTRPAQRHPRRRARLFPGAPLPELRQPRAARRGLACRQGGLRRGPRRGAGRIRSLSRLPRRHQAAWGSIQIREKYGNLFEIYERITGEDAYQVPMRIYPAVHYTMGGLWVDYHLMSNHPGTVRRRRGQLLGPGGQSPGGQRPHAGPGRRLLHPAVPPCPTTWPRRHWRRSTPRNPAFREAEAEVHERIDALLESQGPADRRQHPPRAGQADVGRLRHDPVGGEPAARAGQDPRAARGVPHQSSACSGTGEELNQSLEKAGRVADFLELAELMCIDALHRNESCGGHYPRGEPDPRRRGPAR